MLPLLFTFATAMFAVDNAEFIATTKEQRNEGYTWHKIECRAPNKELPHISIRTPIENEYVCWKLTK